MSASRQPTGMTVVEFEKWVPDEKADHRWNLVDGVPVCMAPASSDHARIVARLTALLLAHVDANMPGCDVLVAPGVIPTSDSIRNERVPDIGVTCEKPSKRRTLAAPILLVEVRSPSHADMTRNNAAAYGTIASVREVVLLGSQAIAAEVCRRLADGAWPASPVTYGPESELELCSIGFRSPLRDLYRTTSLNPRHAS